MVKSINEPGTPSEPTPAAPPPPEPKAEDKAEDKPVGKRHK